MTSPVANLTYGVFGKSTACKADGEGGPYANEVYRLRNFVPKYVHLGCVKYVAVKTLEKQDYALMASYSRARAVLMCSEAARRHGFR